MKFLLLSILVISTSAQAASHGHSYAYLYDESGIYSSQFIEDCYSTRDEAAKNAAAAESALGLPAGTLAVDAQIQYLRNGPVNQPPYQNGLYECFILFDSTDAKVDFARTRTPLKTHLSKPDWGTACQVDYNQLSARPGSLYTDYLQSWSLFQGRICAVDHVEAIKKSE